MQAVQARSAEARSLTPEDLIAFEAEIEADFNAGKIRAPVHLAGGNETQLIEIFREVHAEDWCLCSWRSHYHCLLKGVSRETLRRAIHDGRSIALCFPEQRVLSSAMVGGIAPIAVGLAMGIQKRGGFEQVWCFLGDMSAECGIVHEAMKYAAGRDLPIRWVVEDNGLSVGTDTKQAWGVAMLPPVMNYEYVLTRKHVGTGKWVSL